VISIVSPSEFPVQLTKKDRIIKNSTGDFMV
jgi:hypothetical protein